MSVETWAAQEAVQRGTIPEIYEPLEAWVSDSFRMAYIAHLLATAGFGWSILRAGFLAPWVGSTAIGWSIVWLAAYPLGLGAPGILFIMPAVISVGLLWPWARPTRD